MNNDLFYCFIFLILVGTLIYSSDEDAKTEAEFKAQYCEMVKAGKWVDYLEIYKKECL